MSDSLSSFVVSAIEFIIGGLMLLIAGIYVCSAPYWDNLKAYHQLRGVAEGTSTFGALVILLAVAYPLGVFSESLSRALMERDLVAVTANESAFTHGDGPPPPTPLADDDRSYTFVGRLAHWLSRKIPSQVSAAQHDCVRVREWQRAKVMQSPGLYVDIELQLKRLRLERMTLLSTLVIALGLLIRLFVSLIGRDSAGDLALLVVEFVIGMAIAAVLALLVHSRFARYCSSIARTYQIAKDAGNGDAV